MIWDEEESAEGTDEDIEGQLQDMLDVEAAAATIRPLALTVAGYYRGLTLSLTPDVAIILALSFQNTILLDQLARGQQMQGGSSG